MKVSPSNNNNKNNSHSQPPISPNPTKNFKFVLVWETKVSIPLLKIYSSSFRQSRNKEEKGFISKPNHSVPAS